MTENVMFPDAAPGDAPKPPSPETPTAAAEPAALPAEETAAIAVETPVADPAPDASAAVLPEPSESEPAKTKPEAAPAPVEEEPPPENRKLWYAVKVQSGREDTIKEAIERRVRKEGLEEFFGQIVIPVEKVTRSRRTRTANE